MGDTTDQYISSRLPFWGSLSDYGRASLSGAARGLRCKKDSVIHSGGDAGIILVRRGRLSVRTLSCEGRELVLIRIFAGGICALASGGAMAGAEIPLRISAETESEIIVIDSAAYGEVCKSNIEAESFTRSLLAGHLADLAANMQSMILQSPERRIVSFICGEAERTGSPRIRVTHEQVAQNIGTAREVVSRVLGRLAQSGEVSLERGVIVIHDKEKLCRLTAGMK